MKKENALFIARILEDCLKEETRYYTKSHSLWVNDLIKATIEFFEENGFYRWELNRLINSYKETKNWNDNKNNEEVK